MARYKGDYESDIGLVINNASIYVYLNQSDVRVNTTNAFDRQYFTPTLESGLTVVRRGFRGCPLPWSRVRTLRVEIDAFNELVIPFPYKGNSTEFTDTIREYRNLKGINKVTLQGEFIPEGELLFYALSN